MSDKLAARTLARSRLATLTPADRAAASRKIADSVWSIPRILSARVILLYASTPTEVETDAIALEAVRRGIRLAYPRCLPGGGQMVLHDVGMPGDLRGGGRFGIREPSSECTRVGVAEIDAALLPGLAWDRAGARLGRGAGYYDRILANPEWRAFTCGLFFADQELPALPTDPWDRSLDAVVTERETVLF